MTYMQLITRLSDDTKYTRRELRAILRHTAKIITEALSGGQRVQWDAVGAFINVPEGAHHVRNYKTGERYWTKPRRKVKFKPCDILRNKVRRSVELFQDTEASEQYLPKKEHSGKIRSGDRPKESGTGEAGGEEPIRQPQHQHPFRSG